ncbi:hypothetical protein CK203_083152 [Vitis vinifera]|uniref:Uncharacterized protein n=1 Tax=Vitis vinifera TaxID=29760 RepID=A0A438DWQ5_VITVI|nr:hypothetical protein CK203_083152 [Vitis vinifera]
MLFQLDLSLLEVLFIYTIKMSPKERFSLSAHIHFLQFVTNLLDSSKGWAKEHVLVSGPWSALLLTYSQSLCSSNTVASRPTSNSTVRLPAQKKKSAARPIQKKTCSAPDPNSPSKPTPSTPTTVVTSGLNEKPSSIGDIPYHEMRKPFIVLGSINKESFECPNPSPLRLNPAYIPNQEEMSEFLSHATIAYIIHLKDYITFKTAEVVEEEKKAFQAKTCRLVEEKATTVAEKEKTEEETAGLRQKLQDLWAGFATQKEDLEVNYQKQVDDMFFYGYQCCMKKHGIANDTPNLSSNDENDEFLGGFTQ